MSTQQCSICRNLIEEEKDIAGYWLPDLEGPVKLPLCKDCVENDEDPLLRWQMSKPCDGKCDGDVDIYVRTYVVCPKCGAEVPIDQSRENYVKVPVHQKRELGGYQPLPTKGKPIPPKEE